MKMTHSEIVNYANKFLEQNYNIKLEIPILINGRIKKSLGKFKYRLQPKQPISIEISKYYLANGKLDDIQSTIRHECIHYALFVQDKPFRDGESYFENELKKHKTHSTGTTSLKVPRKISVYSCNCSTWKYKRALRNNGKFYQCQKCSSYLKFEKSVIEMV